MTSHELILEIRSFCRTNADPALVQKYSRYFKEGYDAYGVPSPVFLEKVRELLNSGTLGLAAVSEASFELMKGSKYEEPSFAILLLKGFSKSFGKETFRLIEKWYALGIHNWAHSDVLCNELLTPMILKGIIVMEDLSSWRSSPFPFQRRSVPVALIKPAKKSPEIEPYLDFISVMMSDQVRVVHQGLGWFLREAWKVYPALVEMFLLKWKNESARLIFQYATEKMDKEKRIRFRRDKTK